MSNEKRGLWRVFSLVISATLAASIAGTLAGCGQSSHSNLPGKSAGPGNREQGGHASIGHTHVAPHGGQVQAVGDNHFELTYDSATGRFTLHVLGEQESKSAPIAEQEIGLQVRDEASGEFKSIKLNAVPLDDEPHGKSSRFVASSEELVALSHFTAVARVPVADDSHRVSFQFSICERQADQRHSGHLDNRRLRVPDGV